MLLGPIVGFHWLHFFLQCLSPSSPVLVIHRFPVSFSSLWFPFSYLSMFNTVVLKSMSSKFCVSPSSDSCSIILFLWLSHTFLLVLCDFLVENWTFDYYNEWLWKSGSPSSLGFTVCLFVCLFVEGCRSPFHLVNFPVCSCKDSSLMLWPCEVPCHSLCLAGVVADFLEHQELSHLWVFADRSVPGLFTLGQAGTAQGSAQESGEVAVQVFHSF